MRFVLKRSVSLRLTLSILLAILFSWLLSSASSYYIARQNIIIMRREMLANPQLYPNPIPKPRLNFINFLLGAQLSLNPPPRPANNQPPRPPAEQPLPGEVDNPPPHNPGETEFDSENNPPPPSSMSSQRPPADSRMITDNARRSLQIKNSKWFELSLILIRSIIALSLAMGVGIVLSRRFTKPLKQLASAAREYRTGDFKHRLELTDEDEFTEVAAAMNEMAIQVEQKIANLEEDAIRRRQLLADVAHELRNPVMTMRTMAGALGDGLAVDEERRNRAVESLVNTSDRLLHLVTDLLELAKLDLNELPMHIEEVDVRTLVQMCEQAHQVAATQANVTIRPLEDGEPVMINADPNKLSQVIDNLINNAISYAGAGSTVSFSITTGEKTTITVADNGIGIPSQHLPYIFDSFYRVNTVRSPGDRHSGLGLRIARGIIEAHHGTLTMQSEVGAGTKVIITI